MWRLMMTHLFRTVIFLPLNIMGIKLRSFGIFVVRVERLRDRKIVTNGLRNHLSTLSFFLFLSSCENRRKDDPGRR